MMVNVNDSISGLRNHHWAKLYRDVAVRMNIIRSQNVYKLGIQYSNYKSTKKWCKNWL